MKIDVKVEDREFRRNQKELPCELTQWIIERQLEEFRRNGQKPDEILIGRNVARPSRTTIGGVTWRVSYQIPANQIVIQRRTILED